MKTIAGVTIILCLLAGCVPGQIKPLPTSSPLPPSSTPPGTSTPTPAPTATATVTPRPTPALPVAFQTSIPVSQQKIAPSNLDQLREIARYYGNVPFTAALTRDRSLYFVGDATGVDVYDNSTHKLLYHVDGIDAYEMQVSADGHWALVNQGWLIHLNPPDEPKTYDLHKELTVPFGQVALSPDGSKIAVSEGPCSVETCRGIFQIISLPDFGILYSWNDGTYKSMHGNYPAFTADSALLVTQVDNNVIFWRMPDGVQETRIKNIQGWAPYVLSEDGSTIAIGQINTVQIWDVASQKRIQTIKDLCGSLGSPPRPILLDSERVAVLECAYSQEARVSAWHIADASLSDRQAFGNVTASRIVFVGNTGRVTLLTDPRPQGPWSGMRQLNSLQYLTDGTLAFQYRSNDLQNMGCMVTASGHTTCSEDVIAGTDGEIYKYTVNYDTPNTAIEFRQTFESGNGTSYSVSPWKGYMVNALDPIHGLVFFTTHPNVHTDSSSLAELVTGRLITQWPYSYIQAMAFSGNNVIAAICRKESNGPGSNKPGIDRLTIMDLSQRMVIQEVPYSCYVPLVLNHEGTKLFSVDVSTVSWGYTPFQYRLLMMNTAPPAQKKTFDIGCTGLNALALSPDESLLAVACDDQTVRFVDPRTAEQVSILSNAAPGIWGLAFSPDGTRLSMISGAGVISIWAAPPFEYSQ